MRRSKALRQAMLAADKAKLEALVSDQLSYGHSSGVIETKAQFVGVVAGKKTIYKSINLSGARDNHGRRQQRHRAARVHGRDRSRRQAGQAPSACCRSGRSRPGLEAARAAGFPVAVVALRKRRSSFGCGEFENCATRAKPFLRPLRKGSAMAHARTPWWTWAWPLFAWIVFCCRLCGAASSPPLPASRSRHRVRSRLPRRGGGAPSASRSARWSRCRRHGHRGGADLSVMIAAPDEKAGLARDTVFAAVMIVATASSGCACLGRRAPSRAGFSAPGRERRSRRAGRAHHADAGPAQLRHHRARSAIQHLAARVRRGGVAGALRLVRVRPDRAPPRLLPAGRERRRGGARVAAVEPDRLVSVALLLVALVAVVGLAKVLTPTVEAGVARSSPEGGGGHRDRGPGAAAGRPGGVKAPRARPPADQPEPGARLGARHHRPDHPGGGGRLDRARHAARARARREGQLLLALTLLVGVITLGTGRTTVLQGIVHLVIFAVFLFFAVVP